MVCMLDDVFRGIFRDVVYTVAHLENYRDAKRLVTETIQMTDRPSEISEDQWNTFVYDMSHGVHGMLKEGCVPRSEIVRIVFQCAISKIV